MAVYYGGGAFSAVAAHRVANGGTRSARRSRRTRAWQALVLVPAALARRVRVRFIRSSDLAGDRGYRAEAAVVAARAPRPMPAASPSMCGAGGRRRWPCTRVPIGPCSAFPASAGCLQAIRLAAHGALARRAGYRLGSYTARVHAVLERSARSGRLEGGVRLAAGEHAHLDRTALSRAPATATPAARNPTTKTGPSELSHARGRVDRRDRALAGDAAVRARSRGHWREHRQVHVPERFHARGDGPVPRHSPGNDQAVCLV